MQKLQSSNFRIRYHALRGISNRFIAKDSVREYIFSRKGRKCYICGSQKELQIDHKISVYQGALDRIPYDEINSYINLMPICKKCNSKKRVEET